MYLQAWKPDMTLRWRHEIADSAPGARGSHMCPITDLNGDGVQEVMWGERCIELETGKELFCADRDQYRGHSDVVQPFRDPATDRWFLFTARESDGKVSPRVAVFNAHGERIWGAVEQGHMDMGWVARLGSHGEPIAMAIRIGGKTAGPEGFRRSGVTEFTYHAVTGKPVELPFAVYETVPVDINGDAIHELVRPTADDRSEIIDRDGKVLADLGRDVGVVLTCKLLARSGEQIVTWHPEGRIDVWYDENAQDSAAAESRYVQSLYRANRRLGATGANRCVLGGIY